MLCPAIENNYQLQHIVLLANSYQHFLQKPLLPGNVQDVQFARAVFEAPFALVSHDTQSDPVFNYANRKALQLFAMEWEAFMRTPSRLSAEAPDQVERQRLLKQVNRYGFIDHYQGVRISKQGQRFFIKNAKVWNVIDKEQRYYGQAACFSEWEWLTVA